MRDQLGAETGSLERSGTMISGRAKIEKLLGVLGDLSDGDVARITHQPVELVREVRGAMERER